MSIYKQFGIYRITNTVNGMSYIGKTGVSFGDRWDCHKAQLRGNYHDNKELQNDWNQYGEEYFEFAIIESVLNKEDLNNLEIKYIKEYKEIGLSYNIGAGGDNGSMLGRHMSEDTKQKIGEKNRQHMLGRKLSEETKRKMSESQKRRFKNMTEEEMNDFKKKISNRGSYVWSDESKNIFSKLQQTNPNGAKYTIDDVKNIRVLHEKNGLGYTEISNRLGIPRGTVYNIATYRRWANV